MITEIGGLFSHFNKNRLSILTVVGRPPLKSVFTSLTAKITFDSVSGNFVIINIDRNISRVM